MHTKGNESKSTTTTNQYFLGNESMDTEWLSKNQQQLQEQGFAIFGPLSDQEELTFIKSTIDQCMHSEAAKSDENYFDLGGSKETGKGEPIHQLLFPSRYAPELKQTQCWKNACQLAAILLNHDSNDVESLIIRDHAIFKPVGANATPWHQDEAYWKAHLDYNEINIWIALDKVSLEMGCMQFIPKSNHMEVFPHHHVNNNKKIIALEVDEGITEKYTAVACPLEPGFATIHTPRTLHYTSANHGDKTRPAYIFTIGTKPVEREQPRNFYWNDGQRTY